MSQIHRKKTTQELIEKLATVDPSCYFSRRDLENALEVIKAQDELLTKMGKNLSNMRKSNKAHQHLSKRKTDEIDRAHLRALKAEARLEILRDKIWKVERLFRTIAGELKESSLMEVAFRHVNLFESKQKFLDELDKDLDRQAKNS